MKKIYFIFDRYFRSILKLIIIKILFIFSFSAFGEKAYPSGPYTIYPEDPTTSQIGELDFYQIISKVYSLYSEELEDLKKRKGWELKLELQWKNPFFTAYAVPEDSYNVQKIRWGFWGGLARAPMMTESLWVFIACHEMGHVLGGSPHNPLPYHAWTVAEGQADYFATAHCVRRYVNKYKFKSKLDLDGMDSLKEECKGSLSCEASLSVAKAYGQLHGYTNPSEARAIVRDPLLNVQIKKEWAGYPDIQCRLDTMVAGGFCQKDPEAKFLEVQLWSCDDIGNRGRRPLCWMGEAESK